MDAGKLRHRILFEKYDEERDRWHTWYRCGAAVNALYGSEYWDARAQQAQNTVNFTVRDCRILGCVTPQRYRIVFEGRVYDIEHVDHVRYEGSQLKIKAVEKYER